MVHIPIKECSDGDKKGFKWGNAGKCYLHDGSEESIGKAKEKAYLQDIAEGDGKLRVNFNENHDEMGRFAEGSSNGGAKSYISDKYSKNKVAASMISHADSKLKEEGITANVMVDDIVKNGHSVGGMYDIGVDSKTGEITHDITINQKNMSPKGFEKIQKETVEWNKSHDESFTVATEVGKENITKYNEAIVNHEIGHSVLADYTVKTSGEACPVITSENRDGTKQYFVDPMKIDAYTAKMADGPSEWQSAIKTAADNGWKAPSYYAKSSPREMFAECYSLYQAGQSDRLDPSILSFVNKVSKGR